MKKMRFLVLCTRNLKYCMDGFIIDSIDSQWNEKLCFKIAVSDLIRVVMMAKAKSDMQKVKVA